MIFGLLETEMLWLKGKYICAVGSEMSNEPGGNIKICYK